MFRIRYDTNKIIQLLDSATIGALFRLYGIRYDSIAYRLRITRQAVTYKQRTDSWKPYERQIVLELLQQYGLEISELILVNKMINTAKKRTDTYDRN